MTHQRIYSVRLDTDADNSCNDSVADSVALPFEARQKARQRVTLTSGAVAGLKLPRGSILRDGDRLTSEDGHCIRIDAAPESVSRAHSADSLTLARAAYHLGNRHVWLQVGDNWVSYLHDHVLDAMVRGLGLTVDQVEQPFEPEAGAYSHGAHSNPGHSHDH